VTTLPENCTSVRPKGNVRQYEQCDLLSQNCYNQHLLGLKCVSDLTATCNKINLKTSMQLTNKIFIFYFLLKSQVCLMHTYILRSCKYGSKILLPILVLCNVLLLSSIYRYYEPGVAQPVVSAYRLGNLGSIPGRSKEFFSSLCSIRTRAHPAC
jgi:hypothetical protein